MNRYDLKLEAEVNGRDKKLGRLAKLVVDPDTWQVSDLVIVGGLLVKRSLVAPLSLVERMTPLVVYLATNSDELGDYPEYTDTIVEKGDLSSAVAQLKTGINELEPQAPSFLKDAPDTIPTKERLRTGVPDDALVLDSNTVVDGLDGRIGQLKRLIVGRENGRIHQLIVEIGKLLPQQVIIPVEKIDALSEKNIKVRVSADEVPNLPEYFVPSSDPEVKGDG